MTYLRFFAAHQGGEGVNSQAVDVDTYVETHS